MNQMENSLEHIHLSSDKLLGQGNWKGNLDLINIVMIGLSKELPDKEEELKLHRLLGALFSQQLTAKQRLGIIEDEYIGTMEQEEKEVYSLMCNLSQGIKEEALAEGISQGIALGEERGIALGEARAKVKSIENVMKSFQCTLEEACKAVGSSLTEYNEAKLLQQ